MAEPEEQSLSYRQFLIRNSSKFSLLDFYENSNFTSRADGEKGTTVLKRKRGFSQVFQSKGKTDIALSPFDIDEEELDEDRAQTKRKDYLVSTNGDNAINLESLNHKWILKSGHDLSTSFLKRRNELVGNCADCSILLKPDEELAINGIFLLDGDVDSNIVLFNCYEEACNEIKERYLKYKDKDAESHSQDIFRFTQLIAQEDFAEAENQLNASNLPNHIKAILYTFKQTYCKGYTIENHNESTTVKDGILPFLENYFCNSKRYTTFGADKEITESRERFTDIDPSLTDNACKGDFSIVTNLAKHLIFSLEAKSERNRGGSKADLIKMARYMKDTLDAIQNDGFNDVAIAGMLTSGVSCSSYIMERKSDYIYRLYKQSKFYIPMDYNDMYRINGIFPLMSQLKNVLQETIAELGTLQHERS
ncbi:hypothetical protein MAM1_0018c01641 [Mucor ambiguus]|uniref:Uncharacterized protein n=1 Tax=Mucor ambiguus TaxID=91626 RepID=A0A0C9LRM2_9FUNG|nr:hypothetical protein MAM1_0018c01641 [Mucor ambiguus]